MNRPVLGPFGPQPDNYTLAVKINELSRKVAGQSGAPAGGNFSAAVLADLQARITALEREVSLLKQSTPQKSQAVAALESKPALPAALLSSAVANPTPGTFDKYNKVRSVHSPDWVKV